MMGMEHPVDDGYIPVVNRPDTIRGVVITFIIIACIAVGLRLYVRLKDRLWGWDDLFVFLAALIVAIGSGLTCLMPNTGMGRHFWTLNDEEVMEYFKHVYSTNATYTASTTFIKLSILFQYLRLFEMQNRFARKVSWFMIGLTACWGITFLCLALFSCTPIQKNWNFTLEGKCVAWGSKDSNVFFASWAAHAASNMMLDILVLLLPIPFLGGLRMGGKTRLGFICLFSMGGVVATLSVARMIALSLKRAGTVPYFDPTFATPAIYIFSVLEVDVAILCASIPIFWPLVTSFAANKILVVNEIEIRTDRRESQAIGLAEQGSGGAFAGLGDDGESKGRTSRMSTLIHGSDFKVPLSNSRMVRSVSRSRYAHAHKPSSASSINKPMGMGISIELGHRQSQESQRKLAHPASNGALSFESESPDLGKRSEERGRNGSIVHYQDKYTQGWVCPDFESPTDANSSKGGGAGANAFETTVESVPFDHIGRLEKR